VAERVAGPRRPNRREAFVGAATHDHGVAGEQQVGLDFPADPAVRPAWRPLVWLLDDTVDGYVARVDDATHESSRLPVVITCASRGQPRLRTGANRPPGGRYVVVGPAPHRDRHRFDR